MLDQQLSFEIPWIGTPLKSVLKVDADLVEWTLKVPMSVPAFIKTIFNQPEIVEDATGLCELTKLIKNSEHFSPDFQPSVREIYSSNVVQG